uniref:Uncharacterized protein n=1 Tax=Panagrolaimus sp. PS1159 TaxID=55785 RepID=A0AC35FGB1_9BILA
MTKFFNVFFYVLVIGILAITIQPSFATNRGTIVNACNEVCSRSTREWESCCKAHGYIGRSGEACDRGGPMYCS